MYFKFYLKYRKIVDKKISLSYVMYFKTFQKYSFLNVSLYLVYFILYKEPTRCIFGSIVY